MHKISRLIALLIFSCLVFVICLSSPFVHLQAQVVEEQYVKGEIVEVSLIKPRVTIRFIQEDGDSDEMTFCFTQHTRINKDDLMLSLTDLHKGDEVAIAYYDDPMSFSALTADTINVKP